jgi:hypothetical protein
LHNVVFHWTFSKPRLVVVKLRNVKTGKYLTGVVSAKHIVTFRNVPDGTYRAFRKYPHGKVHTIGTFAITAGKAKVAPHDSEKND